MLEKLRSAASSDGQQCQILQQVNSIEVRRGRARGPSGLCCSGITAGCQGRCDYFMLHRMLEGADAMSSSPLDICFKASTVREQRACVDSATRVFGALQGLVCVPGLTPSSPQHSGCHGCNCGSPRLPAPPCPQVFQFPLAATVLQPLWCLAARCGHILLGPMLDPDPMGSLPSALVPHGPRLCSPPAASTRAATSPDVPHFLLERLIPPFSVPCVVPRFLLSCVCAGLLFLGCFFLSRSV